MQKMARRIAGTAANGKAPLPTPDAVVDALPLPDVARIPARTVIALDGAGPPEAEPFQRAVPALYGVAYGLKFAQKARGLDFRIGPLEARWWAEPPPYSLASAPRDTWRWQVRLGVPDRISADDVTAAADAAVHRKGGKLAGSPEALLVRRLFLDAQPMGRILHTGPYAEEGPSLEAARAALVDAGLTPAGPHVEVYLNDPGRTAPQRLRTVLLVESAR
jgi:hypothetical protein